MASAIRSGIRRLVDLVEEDHVPPWRIPLRPVGIGGDAVQRLGRGQVARGVFDRLLDGGAQLGLRLRYPRQHLAQ